MDYSYFINQYIHPFIIYVFVGTLVSYLLARGASHLKILGGSRTRALIYGAPFMVPLLAYGVHRPYMEAGCFIFGRPLGVVNDWLCNAGTALAVILTPLSAVVLVVALVKAVLSIYATFRIVRRFGYASAADYPRLFSVTEKLSTQGSIRMPRIIITKDAFTRCFTMGYWTPVIVLSAGIVEAMDDEEMETVIAHELGHIARADSLFTWFTVLVRDVMFFSPLVYWIFRDLAAEREKAADDIAVTLTQKPLAFAGALIKAWRLSPRSFIDTIMLDNFMPHPNLAGHAGILELRVRRILDGDQGKQSCLYCGYAAVIFISVATVVLLSLFC